MKRTRWFMSKLLAALGLCLILIGPLHIQTAQAVITPTGDVDPTLPWGKYSSGHVGHSDNGALRVDGGSLLESSHAYLGFDSGVTGEMTVTGSGSAWNSTNGVHVGYSGIGTLDITGGGTLTNQNSSSSWKSYLGYNNGSTGVVTVDGAGSTWINNSYLHVGYDGNGTLNVTNDGLVTIGRTTFVGSNTGAINFGTNGGTLTTNSLWASPNQLTGTGTINTRGLVSDATLLFDAASGAMTTCMLNSEPGQNITIDLDLSNSWGELGAGYQGNGSVTIQDGVSVQSTRGYLGYNSGSTGSATVTGSGSAWNNSQDLYVGRAGNGTLAISDGALVENTYGYVGYESSSTSAVTVNGTNSTWNNSEDLYIGRRGNGTLDISNGGTVTNDTSYLGFESGAAGTVTVSGAGSLWDCGTLHVGHSGDGTLNIFEGSSVTPYTTSVATNEGATGRINFGENGGTLTTKSLTAAATQLTGTGTINTYGLKSDFDVVFDSTSGLTPTFSIQSQPNQNITVNLDLSGTSTPYSYTLGVGYQANGSITIKDGLEVKSSNVFLGMGDSATGTASVTGAGSKWNTASIYVGQYGTGTLAVTDGGNVSNGSYSDVYLGFDSSSTGTVTVEDPDSKLDIGNELYVGRGGNGTLEIANGGTAINEDGYIGYISGSTGQVTVGDAGSSWTNDELYVGHSGNGTLDITGGGNVVCGGSYLGYNTGSTGTVTVEGAGSTWASGNLSIGTDGDGTLNIHNGGAVTASNAYVAQNVGSTGSINFGDNGGSLSTEMIWVGENQLTGTGTINTKGLVSDVDLVFDSSHGLAQTVTLAKKPGQNITFNIDVSNSYSLKSIGVGYQGSGSLAIRDGVEVRSTVGYLGYGAGSTGTAIIDGPGSNWYCGQSNIGYHGNGTLAITNGGTITNQGQAHIGRFSGSTGAVTVTGNGSIWDISNSPFYVGESGHGTLEIKDRGHVISSSSYLGHDAGSTGNATVDGSGSKWSIDGVCYVGRFGNGTLNITNQGVVSVSNNTYVARQPGTTGSINFGDDGGTLNTISLWAATTQLTGTGTIYTHGLVSDVDLLYDSSHGLIQSLTLNDQPNQNIALYLDLDTRQEDLGVGNQGSASLTIREGIVVTSRSGYLGYAAGSTGTATISGLGSRWTCFQDLFVGHSGDGRLEIRDGSIVSTTGSVHSSAAYLGYESGSTGTLIVDGNGSEWYGSNDLFIGDKGKGILEITNGGAVSNYEGCIGRSNDSIGVVTVDGPGSTWHSNYGLIVQNGSLTISNGGFVSNYRNASITSLSDDSTSVVTVTDPDSMWAIDSNLEVGDGGNATLVITNGGAVINEYGTIGRYSNDKSMVIVDGVGSTWTNRNGLFVNSHGMLRIINGGTVSSTSGYIRSSSEVMVDGPGSTWANSGELLVGESWHGEGTLNIVGGGTVTAQSVSLENEGCLMSIAVAGGSSLNVGGGSGAITNEGIIRILAGTKPAAGATYTPIAAGTWTGTGTTQALGGTWDAVNHQFTVSQAATGVSGDITSIDLAGTQRVLVNDTATGRSVGASFLAMEAPDAVGGETLLPSLTALHVTATLIDGELLDSLETLLDAGESVQSAWDFVVAGAYTSGDPAHLSFEIGADYCQDDLRLWHHDGTGWNEFSATDLNYDGLYANFTVTDFSGYAVSAVPEPGTIILLLSAGLCLLLRRPSRKRNG